MKKYSKGIVRFLSGFEIIFDIYKDENNFTDLTSFYVKYQESFKQVKYNKNERVWCFVK